MRASFACLAAALTLWGLGCATAPHAGPRPDWVDSGGRTPRYPDARYVTGFSLGEDRSSMDAVKQRAAADLASRLEVRIEHELRDVSENKDGVETYHVAAMMRSTVDLKLSGLEYETWSDGNRVWALAIVERGPAAERRRAERNQELVAVRACLASARTLEQDGRPAQAVAGYEDCRAPVARALEHTAVIGALVGVTPADDVVFRELVESEQTIGDKLESVLREPVESLPAAAESLAVQLARQGVSTDARIVVSPFTYGTADVSSAFGRQAALDLESALARHAHRNGGGGRHATLAVRGVYVERAGDVRMDVTVKEAESARLVASAGTRLPRAALPADLELKPSNFAEALEAQRVLSDGGLITGDLRVELWTSKGRKGVVLTEKDAFKIFLRVNQPAFVRLLYVLQNGAQVPIDQAFYIDASKVNFVVEYPQEFEVVPPFGVEHIYATAFTERPPPLATRPQIIDGERYDVVVNGIAEIANTRGLRVKRDEEIAESFVAVTTTPR
jgi:hypothetical protein